MKRVAEWSHSKDFYAMLQTLNEFKGLELSKGIGTAARAGATAAQLKKAFHRASPAAPPARQRGRCGEGRGGGGFRGALLSYDEARSAAEALSA